VGVGVGLGRGLQAAISALPPKVASPRSSARRLSDRADFGSMVFMLFLKKAHAERFRRSAGLSSQR